MRKRALACFSEAVLAVFLVRHPVRPMGAYFSVDDYGTTGRKWVRALPLDNPLSNKASDFHIPDPD